MSNVAIRVEHLSKAYRIAHQTSRSRYHTLRDDVTNALRAPLRRWHAPAAERQQPSELFYALDDVSFDVHEGEVVGIIGRNGAGKSTLLKILSRITEPTRGRAEIYGRVGSLLEVGTGFHPELTGRENIFLSGAVLGMTRAEVQRKFDEIVAFAEVEKFLDTPAKHYSSGMYVRLGFAVAAHLEPEILLVDEVLAVGDINFRRKSLGKMHAVSRSGRTVFFVSHDMSSIRQLCQRVLWLDAGKLKMQGTAEETTLRYEAANLATAQASDGHFARAPQPARDFYIEWVELRDREGKPRAQYRFGEPMEIVFALRGQAPQDGYTVEWVLFNERGNRISFGAANPVRDVYFNRGDNRISCRLESLPLTTGSYHFYLSVRVWGLARWDEWEDQVAFRILLCDPYNSGFDIPAGPGGDFVLAQQWSVIRA